MPPKKTKSESKKPEPDSDVEESDSEPEKPKVKEKEKKKEKNNRREKKCEYCNGESTLYYWYKFPMQYNHGGRGTKIDVIFGSYIPLKGVDKKDLEREIQKDYQIIFPWMPAFNHLYENAYESKNYADAFPLMHRLAKGRLYFLLDNKGADLVDEDDISDDDDIPSIPVMSTNPPIKTIKQRSKDDGIISLDSYSKPMKL